VEEEKGMFVCRRVVRHDYKALYQHLFFHSIHIHQYTKQFHAQIRKASNLTVPFHSFGGQLATFCCFLLLLILFLNTINNSVVDPDPDPDPAFQVDSDPDPELLDQKLKNTGVEKKKFLFI
jgi:hypothetical protein